MKKIINLLLIGFFAVACSNDESPKEPELVSITTNYYVDNEIIDSSKSNYSNQQLQNVQNLDQSRTEYKYNNNLIASASNYEPDGFLFSTNKYTFDSNDRLTEDAVVFSDNSIIKYTITYNENSILVTYSHYNGNSIVYELELNGDKQVISKRAVLVNGAPPKANSLRYQYTYAGKNLISVTSFNAATNITTPLVTYTYGTLKNETDSSRHMYGKAWKMNSFLMVIVNQGNYTPQVSENLISSYKEGTRDAVINREYRDGKISKTTTEYNTSWDVAMKIESVYEYK
ncbi:hypothetical protein L1276_001026 [Flavobacterium sp. HSC-32F16]|uniref:hypothetical protein n=1 Tax=Flavobacterium sp. HSC-32F16 TaxID=2910964 RepID=UPI0020A4DFDC|nr:hypothetical protein [Flavobacterium sp. HSC-32F16]MCP2025886.1 hypothetical protein [Flavobacterium sp. HSC-32F16]